MILVVLEGPHGAGVTTQAERVQDRLAAQGIRAVAWRHPAPDPEDVSDPWRRALHFAAARSRLLTVLRDAPPAVLIVDRWVTSTVVDALAIEPGTLRAQLLGLAHAESSGLPREHLVVVLDASETSIRWRLRARGEPVSVERAARVQREREVYGRLATERGWPIISTARAAQETTAEIHGLARVAMARGAA